MTKKKVAPKKPSAKTQRERIQKALKPVAKAVGPLMFPDVRSRIEYVREAVAEASTGLEGAEYAELFEALMSDAEGWRMEEQERQAEAAAEAEIEVPIPVALEPEAAKPDEEE